MAVGRTGMGVLIVGTVFSVTAIPAGAAVTCDPDTQRHVLLIQLTAPSDVVNVELRPDGEHIEIEPNDFECPEPTVHNIDLVRIRDVSGGNTAVQILDPEHFGPGATDAGHDSGAGSADEIEFQVDLGPGAGDLLALRGGDHWRYGSRGINPDVDHERRGTHDADIFFSGVEQHDAIGGSFNDRINAMGGVGTGRPFRGRLILEGDFGSDRLIGGPGKNLVVGDFGRDKLYGMAGNDHIEADDGPDLVSGGRGVDTAEWPYAGTTSAVRVDIGAGGANDGAGRDKHRDRVLGDIENLIGSLEADVLIGDDGPNKIFGRDRQDVLVGRGGADHLIDGIGGDYLDDAFFGGRGNDFLDARDESRDRMLNCGPGRDRLRRDEVDPRGSGCERVATTPVPPDAGTSSRSSAIEGRAELLW